jgi:hypothetical protein
MVAAQRQAGSNRGGAVSVVDMTWLAEPLITLEGLDIMGITNAPRPRKVAAWASLAGIAVLLTACNSSTSSAASSASSTPVTVSAPGTPSTTATPAGSAGSPSAPASSPGTPPSSPGVAGSPTGSDVFLAAAQDINGPLLHEPACGGFGCALSGDSTTFLASMTWNTWSGAEAVGTGTYKVNDCNPNCAAGHVYPVATVVTLSQPVKVCSPSGARWVWSHASFTFPDGLPTALQGQNAPQNPWTFSSLITAAQQSCS